MVSWIEHLRTDLVIHTCNTHGIIVSLMTLIFPLCTEHEVGVSECEFDNYQLTLYTWRPEHGTLKIRINHPPCLSFRHLKPFDTKGNQSDWHRLSSLGLSGSTSNEEIQNRLPGCYNCTSCPLLVTMQSDTQRLLVYQLTKSLMGQPKNHPICVLSIKLSVHSEL